VKASLHLSGHAARALLVALVLLAPVLLLSIAAHEVRAGADWIVVDPLRFFLAALLRALPLITFPAMLLAAVWTRSGLDRRGETVLFGLLGRSRWAVATWAALPSLLFALFTLHLAQEAIPRASLALRRPVGLGPEKVAKWIELRRNAPGQGSLFLGAGESAGTGLMDLRMARSEPRTVLRAAEAELRSAGGDSTHMIVELRGGSLMLPALSHTPVGGESIRFEGGRMRLDPEAVAVGDVRRFLRVAETTSSRLARDAALVERATGDTRHVAKLLHERLHRPFASLLPFLLVWLLHWRWARRPYPALHGAELWLVPALMLVTSALPLSLARHAAESSRELALALLALSVLLPLGVSRAFPTRAEVVP